MRFVGYGEMWESQNIPINDTGNGSIKHALKWATSRRYKDKWENDVKDRDESILCSKPTWNSKRIYA